MLSKLLKYEMKSTARTFLPLYGVLLVMALVNKLFMSINTGFMDVPQIIAMMTYVGICVAIFVITFVVVIQRFYKNLMTDEGYLMFTLPVKTDSLIMSKLLVASLWFLLSGVLCIISVFIIAAEPKFFSEFSRTMGLLSQELAQFGYNTPLFTFEFILIMILGLFSSVITIYASIAAGHLFRGHRVMGAFAAYMVFNVAIQIIFSVVTWALSKTEFFHGNYNRIEEAFPEMHAALWVFILFSVLTSVGFYFITRYVLQKRLNLE